MVSGSERLLTVATPQTSTIMITVYISSVTLKKEVRLNVTTLNLTPYIVLQVSVPLSQDALPTHLVLATNYGKVRAGFLKNRTVSVFSVYCTKAMPY